MADIQKQNTGSLSIAGPAGAFGVPQFTYVQDKWSVTRTLNTEGMAAKWQSNPNLVLILSDSKLGPNELAVLRNEKLQQMQKLVRDLMSGEAEVRRTTEMLLEAVSLVETVVHEQKLDEKSQSLAKTLKIVGRLTAEARSMVYLRKEKAPIESSTLTDDEKKVLEELDKE